MWANTIAAGVALALVLSLGVVISAMFWHMIDSITGKK